VLDHSLGFSVLLEAAHLALTLRVASQSFSKKLGPPDSIDEDVSLWSTAVSAVLERMEAMHREHDLEDTRKSI
jgi:hypothetical protein